MPSHINKATSMSLLHPPRFQLHANEKNCLRLVSDSGAAIELFVLERT
jgi:alpha-glucosidase